MERAKQNGTTTREWQIKQQDQRTKNQEKKHRTKEQETGRLVLHAPPPLPSHTCCCDGCDAAVVVALRLCEPAECTRTGDCCSSAPAPTWGWWAPRDEQGTLGRPVGRRGCMLPLASVPRPAGTDEREGVASTAPPAAADAEEEEEEEGWAGDMPFTPAPAPAPPPAPAPATPALASP